MYIDTDSMFVADPALLWDEFIQTLATDVGGPEKVSAAFRAFIPLSSTSFARLESCALMLVFNSRYYQCHTPDQPVRGQTSARA